MAVDQWCASEEELGKWLESSAGVLDVDSMGCLVCTSKWLTTSTGYVLSQQLGSNQHQPPTICNIAIISKFTLLLGSNFGFLEYAIHLLLFFKTQTKIGH